MVEALNSAKQTIMTVVEAEILAVMAKAIESAKSEIAEEAISGCDDIFDAEALHKAIVEACGTFDFSDHIEATNS